MASKPLEGVASLIIRGLNWIGDAVMSLPTIWNLKESLPNTKISIIAPGWSAGLYTLCQAVDEVIEIYPRAGKAGLRSEFTLAKDLKGRKYDAAIILPNSFRSAFAPFLARIPKRWGYRTDGRGLLLTKAVKLKDEGKIEHTVLYYTHLLSELGVTWFGEVFGLKVAEGTRKEALEITGSLGAEPETKKLGISPSAAWGSSKRWPAERFAAVAKALSRQHGLQPLVFGSEKDKELVESVVAAESNAVNLAGAFPELRHLVATIAECELMITNDSGPMHIAAALGVPVVAIFGPTDERRSGPWTSESGSTVIDRNPDCRPCYNPTCRVQGWPCMLDIEAGDVINAAERLLAEALRSEHGEE